MERRSDDVRVGSLFSGIGGLDLGLERAGMEVVWQCEIDPFCQSVLRKHWPDVPCYGDIRDLDESVPPVDLIAGGFPCQPVSLAGKGKAQADERWLWPEFVRVLGALRPDYVLVENVPGLASRGLWNVVADLAALGYDAEWDLVSAASVGAPHLRERLFVCAWDRGSWPLADRSGFSGSTGREPRILACEAGEAQDHGEQRKRSRNAADDCSTGGGTADYWSVEPDVGRVAYGVPVRMDRLRALGNAVVPQVAEWVGRKIMNVEQQRQAA